MSAVAFAWAPTCPHSPINVHVSYACASVGGAKWFIYLNDQCFFQTLIENEMLQTCHFVEAFQQSADYTKIISAKTLFCVA